MSVKHSGLWHYEHIVGRDNGREWRVADSDDDVIADFPTEVEAREYVEAHNTTVPAHRDRW